MCGCALLRVVRYTAVLQCGGLRICLVLSASCVFVSAAYVLRTIINHQKQNNRKILWYFEQLLLLLLLRKTK